MGRGRAKAKQQKVARDLKYNSQSTDLDALQRELGGPGSSSSSSGASTSSGVVADEDEDEYEPDPWTGTAH
jgi:Protein of unknown function (DUF3073)